MALIRDWSPEINFDYSPVSWRFFNDDTRTKVILGPVGSGKTLTCCAHIFKKALEQEPNEEGVRPFKVAIVRNTQPELWRTTIETWLHMFREEYCGPLRRSSPIRHEIRIPDLGDGTSLQFMAEFFALDRPDQVKGLLSYEPTMIYLNELREIARPIVDAAGDRIGRYPSIAKGGVMPTWAGIIGDSNPPDEDHWLFKAYENPPEGWKFFLQPPGLSEVEKISHTHYRAKAGEPSVGEGVTSDMVISAPSGKIFAVNPNAENLPNLPYDVTFDPGARGMTPAQLRMGKVPRLLHKGNYYLSRVPGKRADWIDGYYRNKFTYVVDGEPVIPEFNREYMTLEHIDVLPDVPLGGGYDMGSATLNPAAIIGQRHPSGIYLIHAELSIDEKIGLRRFGEEMVALLQREFPDMKLEEFFGDPAGNTKDGIFAEAYFDHLRGYNLPVKEAPTNSPELIREAIRSPMSRFVRGQPGILINRRRCPKLVKGLAGAWCFRRLNVAGTERFATTAEKNEFSHVCEAAGYWLAGKGEIKDLSNRKAKSANQDRSQFATTEYSYFGD